MEALLPILQEKFSTDRSIVNRTLLKYLPIVLVDVIDAQVVGQNYANAIQGYVRTTTYFLRIVGSLSASNVENDELSLFAVSGQLLILLII